MSSPLLVIVATIALIVASAFFVVIEFSLLAARRRRLEQQAATSRAARAALKGVNELTLMLAVAQLGITACTFALGAVTKPAVDLWLGPILASWGLPAWLAGTSSFFLSLLFVTFLHLVIGEMAPKSWAIAHPETAAKLIGLPARALAGLLRPLLLWINAVANRLVAASGVTPADRAALGGQDLDTLRQLVEHSVAVGTLADSYRTPLTHVFDLETLRVRDVVERGEQQLTSVPAQATAADVRAAAAQSGHLRILVDGTGGVPGVIHVRDILRDADAEPITGRVRAAFVVDAETPVYQVLTAMRGRGEPFAAVTADGTLIGVITSADVLRRVLPNGAELQL